MLSYFLITWILSFFVLCLPLLFITEKEKEEEKNRSIGYEDIRPENSEERNRGDAFDEFLKGFFPKNSKLRFVVNSIFSLNLILLINLPLIILFGFNSFFQFFIQIFIPFLIILKITYTPVIFLLMLFYLHPIYYTGAVLIRLLSGIDIPK